MTTEPDPPFLQSYVVPICTYTIAKGGAAIIHELFGTAFFINAKGTLLTAAHVWADAKASAFAKSRLVGAVVKADGGMSPKSAVAEILESEDAAQPFDVAILKTGFVGPTSLTLGDQQLGTWKDVATFGYPLNAVSGPAEALRLNIRGHKGYVQRELAPGDHPFPPNPPAFEVSFLMSSGLSGAPLFIPHRPRDLVIGVCVGSVRSELIDYQRVEVEEDGKTFKETRMQIEEYGVAHDIRPLFDWKPKLLGGRTLLEAAKD